jgi:hypothetical protein
MNAHRASHNHKAINQAKLRNRGCMRMIAQLPPHSIRIRRKVIVDAAFTHSFTGSQASKLRSSSFIKHPSQDSYRKTQQLRSFSFINIHQSTHVPLRDTTQQITAHLRSTERLLKDTTQHTITHHRIIKNRNNHLRNSVSSSRPPLRSRELRNVPPT